MLPSFRTRKFKCDEALAAPRPTSRGAVSNDLAGNSPHAATHAENSWMPAFRRFRTTGQWMKLLKRLAANFAFEGEPKTVQRLAEFLCGPLGWLFDQASRMSSLHYLAQQAPPQAGSLRAMPASLCDAVLIRANELDNSMRERMVELSEAWRAIIGQSESRATGDLLDRKAAPQTL